jgi:hypothetical protein
MLNVLRKAVAGLVIVAAPALTTVPNVVRNETIAAMAATLTALPLIVILLKSGDCRLPLNDTPHPK